MKSSILILMLSLSTFFQAQKAKPTKSSGALKFTVTQITRSEIKYANEDLFVFEFINKSKKDAVIQNVQTSCGCTTADKPTKPIKPGKKGQISVSYDTRRVGEFTKTITVTSNVGEPVVLTIKGKVLPEKN